MKRRTLSLYNQGKYWYEALPNMREPKLTLLMAAFEEELRQHEFIRAVFGIL